MHPSSGGLVTGGWFGSPDAKLSLGDVRAAMRGVAVVTPYQGQTQCIIVVPAPLGIEPNTALDILRKNLRYPSNEGPIDMNHVLDGHDHHSQRPGDILDEKSLILRKGFIAERLHPRQNLQ